MARKYGKKSQNEVKKEMDRFKKGKAHSGVKLKKVKSRKQAIAIALSKARKKGIKVPKKSAKSSAKKSTKKSAKKRSPKKSKK